MKEIAFLYQELHDFLGRGNISGELCQQIRDIIQTSVDAIPAGARVAINETKGTFHGYDCAINAKITSVNVEKRIEFLKKCFKS